MTDSSVRSACSVLTSDILLLAGMQLLDTKIDLQANVWDADNLTLTERRLAVSMNAQLGMRVRHSLASDVEWIRRSTGYTDRPGRHTLL